MNEWTWILLSLLVAMYLLDFIAGWLNLRSLKPGLPADFEGVYDREDYARLLDYTRVTTHFDWVQSTFAFFVLIVFWLAGGFNWLDLCVRSWNLAPIVTGLCYIGLLWLGNTMLSMPFDLYDTFVIEQKFGFNKTTPGTWIGDQIKGLLVSVVIGGGALALILWLLQVGGPLAWLWAWASSALLMIVLVFLGPAVIMPLFNKFTPLPDGELKTAILEYGRKESFPISGLYVMDGSRRSTRANAFFTGFGRTKKIVLFDTLVANHTVPELVAVLAHEIGHFKLRHVLQHLAVALLNVGVFLFLASLFIRSPMLFGAFAVQQMSIYSGLALFMVFFVPLSKVLAVVSGVQTRKHEYEADRFAVNTTGTPEALIDALKKLSKSNLSNLRPHWLSVILYHSHPPVLQRVEAIRRG